VNDNKHALSIHCDESSVVHVVRSGSITITIVSCNAPASRQDSYRSKRDQQQVMNLSHDEPPQSALVSHG